MNTRKQVSTARKKSINDLKSGKWKREFDEAVLKYHAENDPEIKESIKSALGFMSTTFGINNFPELKQYAKEKLAEIDNNAIEKLTPAEFVKRWKNK